MAWFLPAPQPSWHQQQRGRSCPGEDRAGVQEQAEARTAGRHHVLLHPAPVTLAGLLLCSPNSSEVGGTIASASTREQGAVCSAQDRSSWANPAAPTSRCWVRPPGGAPAAGSCAALLGTSRSSRSGRHSHRARAQSLASRRTMVPTRSPRRAGSRSSGFRPLMTWNRVTCRAEPSNSEKDAVERERGEVPVRELGDGDFLDQLG